MKKYITGSVLLLLSLSILYFASNVHAKSRVQHTAGFALTFDDDNVEAWYGIRDLLKKYQTRATFFVTNVDNLSNQQIEMLFELESDGHEVGFHGKNHLDLNDYIRKASLDDYIRHEIITGVDEMAALGFDPTSFAYPGGSRNKSADVELLKYFKIIRGVSESQRHAPAHNVNQIGDVFYDFDGDRIVNGLGIDNHLQVSIEDLNSGFKRAVDNNEVLILYCHKPAYSDSAYAININYLENILKNAREMNLKSFRISDLAR